MKTEVCTVNNKITITFPLKQRIKLWIYKNLLGSSFIHQIHLDDDVWRTFKVGRILPDEMSGRMISRMEDGEYMYLEKCQAAFKKGWYMIWIPHLDVLQCRENINYE